MIGAIEFPDYISKEDIKKNLSLVSLHLKHTTYHFEKFTFTILDKGTRQKIRVL